MNRIGILPLFLGTICVADQPKVISLNSIPRQPPQGIPIPGEIRDKLEKGCADLAREIADCSSSTKDKRELALLPDVQIFHNAVRYALEDEIFYKSEDFDTASRLLAEGQQRARLLRHGKAPWTNATGLVVRGYRSRVDGSVQPYGIVVPTSYADSHGKLYRLDLWFHGRNNKLSELSFLNDRERSRGEFAPEETFVLHPYGRFATPLSSRVKRMYSKLLNTCESTIPSMPTGFA